MATETEAKEQYYGLLVEYTQNPQYFQRLLEYFLRSRFRAVRLFFRGKLEWMYFAVDGRICDTHDRERRYESLTDWYNAEHSTSYPLWFTEIFKEIHVTGRLSILDILGTVTPKEIAEFRDESYRASLAFGYIWRRMHAKDIPCDHRAKKQQAVCVEWEGGRYYVEHTRVRGAAGQSVERFLDAMASEEPPTGLYHIGCADGARTLLTDVDADAETVVDEADVAPAWALRILQELADIRRTQQEILAALK